MTFMRVSDFHNAMCGTAWHNSHLLVGIKYAKWQYILAIEGRVWTFFFQLFPLLRLIRTLLGRASTLARRIAERL